MHSTQPSIQTDNLAEIATHFAWIDVDARDDGEPWTRGHLADDSRADGPQTEMHDANGHESGSPG